MVSSLDAFTVSLDPSEIWSLLIQLEPVSPGPAYNYVNRNAASYATNAFAVPYGVWSSHSPWTLAPGQVYKVMMVLTAPSEPAGVSCPCGNLNVDITMTYNT